MRIPFFSGDPLLRLLRANKIAGAGAAADWRGGSRSVCGAGVSG